MNMPYLKDPAFIRRLEEFLSARWDRYFALLRDMVAINSYTGNPAGVDRLGDYTAGMFSSLGFTAERVESANPECGLHLHLFRGDSAISAGLVSHLDTVFPPEEEERNDFRFRVSGDRVYGPGTVDVKGGTLVIYMMMDAMTALAPDAADAVTWRVLLDASEETESADFGALCARLLGNDSPACLVFEGGEDENGAFRAVTSRKGRMSYLVEAEGRGAHSGVDHPSGANAIVQLASAALGIHGITDYSRDLTVNIGRIGGGGPLNRVPHNAWLEAEVRAYDPAVLDEAASRIAALEKAPGIASADGRYRASIKTTLVQRCPAWPENPGTEKLFRHYSGAAAMLGRSLERENRGGLSDGNYVWDRVPVLDGLGPAGGNAHCSERTPDGAKDQEYAVIPSFIPKTMLSVLAVMRMLEEGGYVR